MPENRNAVEISVVLAAPDAGVSLARCLEALDAQIPQFSGEILVVHGGGTAPFDRPVSSEAKFRWISSPVGTEVPRLWKAGIDASVGKTVVLLVESCVPNADWLEQILSSRRSGDTVIGGAIDLAPELGVLESAVYFCRYSRYMPPFAAQYLDDLPGTNCAYPRAALEGLQEEMAKGFWETFIHKKMTDRGVQLLCDPAILVRYVGPTPGGAFLRARFTHGREFAARRADSLSRTQRTLRFLAFPMVTFLMLKRVAVRVWAKSKYRTRFLTSSPLLMLFLAAWCTGESLGYLLGCSRTIRGGSDRSDRVLPEVP